MPTGVKEDRVARTFSLLERTDVMIGEIAVKTFRSKANVIDMAVADLYAKVMAGEGENERCEESSSTQ